MQLHRRDGIDGTDGTPHIILTLWAAIDASVQSTPCGDAFRIDILAVGYEVIQASLS